MTFDPNRYLSDMLVLVISLGKLRSTSLPHFLCGTNYQIVPAVNKNDFEHGHVFANRFPSFNRSEYLSNSEYACVQSHKKALQQFLDGQKRFCLILEDDAELYLTHARIRTMLTKEMAAIEETNTLLHCGGMQGLKFEPYFWLRSWVVNITLRRLETRVLYRTMSYVVTRNSAKTYLKYLSSQPCPVADDWFHFVSNTETRIKFKNLFTHPRNDGNSSIASDRHGNA